MNKKISLENFLFYLGNIGIYFLGVLFVCGALTFSQQFSISKMHLPIILLIFTIGYIFFLKEKKLNNTEIITIVSVFLLIIAISIFSSMQIYDTTYDGRAYQQSAMIEMYNGWNPFINPMSPSDLWVAHYPKVTWILGAIFYKTFDSIMVVKAPNLILAISMFCYASGTFIKVFKRKFAAILFGIILTINPIIITQTFTSYVDGFLGIAISILLCAFISILWSKENRKIHYITLAVATILASNVKFTGLVYAFILCGLFFLYNVYQEKSLNKSRNMFVYFTVVFTIAVCVVGYNPYLTNLINKGHPFYPLYGNKPIDIMTANTPEDLRDKNPIEKAFYSTFGRMTNSFTDPVGFYWDYNLNDNVTYIKEVSKVLYSTDMRIGGLGIFTPIIIPFIFLSALYVLLKIKKEFRLHYIFVFMTIIISILVNAEFWWVRYIPQLWFLLAFNVFCIMNKNMIPSRPIKDFILTIMVLLILGNSIMVFAVTNIHALKVNKEINDTIQYLKSQTKEQPIRISFDSTFISTKTLLNEKGVKFVKVEGKPEEAPSFDGHLNFGWYFDKSE